MKLFKLTLLTILNCASIGLHAMTVMSDEDIIINNYLANNLTADQLLAQIETRLVDDGDSYSNKLKMLRQASYNNAQDNLYIKTKILIENAATLCRKLPHGTQVSTLRQKIRSIINANVLELEKLIEEGVAVTRPNSSSPTSFPLIIVNNSSMKLEYKTSSIPATELLPGGTTTFQSIPKAFEMRKIKSDGAKGSWHSLAKPLAAILLKRNSKTGKSALIINDSIRFNPLEWNIETR